MKYHRLFLGLVSLILISGCTNPIPSDNSNSDPPQEDILVSSCGVLDKEGANYILNGDFRQTIDSDDSLRCIIIEANNITLDCQNNSIIGDDYNHSDYLGLSWGISTALSPKFSSDYRFENITIKNCNLDNFSLGLRLRANNSLITDNDLKTGNTSVDLWGSNNTISNNKISSVDQPGSGDLDLISIGVSIGGSNNTVKNNTLTKTQTGIEVFGTEQIIKDNTIENSGGGIRLATTNSTIENNIIKNNKSRGIGISNNVNTEERGNNKIIGNEIESNGQWGIYIDNSPGNTMKNNKISGHSLAGIYFAGQASESSVIGNELVSNGSGLSLSFRYPGDASNDITFTDNTLCDNKRSDFENDTPDFDCKEKIICKQYIEFECIDEETIPRIIDGGGNIWGGDQETICGVTREAIC